MDLNFICKNQLDYDLLIREVYSTDPRSCARTKKVERI